MKNFVMPQIEISKFNMENIVMASGANNWVPAIENEETKVQVNFEELKVAEVTL